jgi:hypothetical protein
VALVWPPGESTLVSAILRVCGPKSNPFPPFRPETLLARIRDLPRGHGHGLPTPNVGMMTVDHDRPQVLALFACPGCMENARTSHRG